MTAAEKPGSNRSGLPPRHQAPSLQPALLNSQVQQAVATRGPQIPPTRVPDPTSLTPQPFQTDRPITPPPPLVVNRPPTPTVLSGSTAEAHAAVHTAAEGALAHFPTDTALQDSSTNDHRRSTANAYLTVNTETHLKQQPAKPHRLEEAIAGFSPHTSLEDTRNILAFNEQGLAPATIKEHAKAWTLWTDFLSHRESLGHRRIKGPLMSSLAPRDQQDMFNLWTMWLRDVQGVPTSKIHAIKSNLRSNWTTANLPPPALEGQRSSKALKMTEDEVRQAERNKREKEKFPMVPEVLMAIFDEKFTNLAVHGATRPSAKQLDGMGGMLAAVLGLESAQRGGNWIQAGKALSKPIRTRDIRFRVGQGEASSFNDPDGGKQMTGQEVRDVLDKEPKGPVNLSQIHRVREVHLDFLITKQRSAVVNQCIGRRTEEEGRILDAITTWLMLSGTKDEDPFLTRYATTGRTRKLASRRLVTVQDRTRAIKESARRAGLDENHFSGASLRKGAVSVCAEAADEETAAQRSGHSTKSGVLHKHYNYSSRGGRGVSVGPSALSRSKSFGLEQLKEIETARGVGSGSATEETEEDKPKEGSRKRQKRNRKTPASRDYESIAGGHNKR